MNNNAYVAIVYDDRILAVTHDGPTVRLCASLVAERQDPETSAAFAIVAKGREVACDALAVGAI